MKKSDLISQKPNIGKLVELMEKNLDKRIAEEKAAKAAAAAKK